MSVGLELLLPKAIGWAEDQERKILAGGVPLSSEEMGLAMRMGVHLPERVRIQMVAQFPRPEDHDLFEFAERAGFFSPGMHGLTLGHGIFLRNGFRANRLVSHECRHVHQYERYGSIGAFLRDYLNQIDRFGYSNAPLEIDAYGHEIDS